MSPELFDYEKKHLEALYPFLGECTLFLKKDESFPLDKPCTIAAYGSGVRYTIKGGTGSGEVNSRFFINIEEGLKNKGFSIANTAWLDEYDTLRVEAHKRWIKRIRKEAKKAHVLAPIYGIGKAMEEFEYDLPLNFDAEACIYVISRQAGEGCDRSIIKGDVLLTDSEVRDILALNEKYERFMLVINTGGYVDLTPVKDVKNILILSCLGVETGNALADILLGKLNPSGKLTSTWASVNDYPYDLVPPKEDTFYEEGRYVGYRYFDSFKKEVSFPFGFGLSYSEFKLDNFDVSNDKENITIKVDVTNISSFEGKEVVQVYVSNSKVYQQLVGYKKTSELTSNKKENVQIEFSLASISEYSRQKGAYIVPQGTYLVRVGNSSRNTTIVAQIDVSEDIIIQHSEPIFKEDMVKELSTSIEHDIPKGLKKITLKQDDFVIRFPDFDEEVILDHIDKLSNEELAELNVGYHSKKSLAVLVGDNSTTVPGAAGETSETFYKLYGKRIIMADGPAGLRLVPKYFIKKGKIHNIESNSLLLQVSEFFPRFIFWVIKHTLLRGKKPGKHEVHYQYATAIPIATAMAQSFNDDFAYLCGDIVGKEMELFNVDMWLAPALNIQRTIVCGRNFEYYSEDPYLSGMMATSITKGVQSHKDRYVVIKHYAANNQETNRYVSNSVINESTFREIYLRGFDLCIKESAPKGIMTSYNLVNGIHTAENYNLVSNHLYRDDAFDGVVMTDWVFEQNEIKNSKNPNSRAFNVYKAGVSLFMPGCVNDVKGIIETLEKDPSNRRQIELNASRQYRNFINNNMKTIYLAGGCFWGVEKYFSLVKGVISTKVGYANGKLDNPTYEDLKKGRDTASEAVKIDYDENVVTLEKLLELYLRVINPYSINKQGEDEGLQYRTGVYFLSDADEAVIKEYFKHHLKDDYKVEVLPLNKFFLAEEYHQEYLNKNPQGYCHINMAILNPEERK